MKIEKDKLVQINYVLKNKDGQKLDESSNGPLEYVHGHHYLIEGLEKQLEGKEKGDKFTAFVIAKEGYGEYDEKLIVDVPRDQFEPDLKIEVGMQFQANSAMGPQIVTVKKVADDKITIDANHELAGQDLTFDVEVVEVRDLTEEEQAQLKAATSCGGGCGGCSGHCGGGNCGGGDCDGDCSCDGEDGNCKGDCDCGGENCKCE